jgi:hypothetical protein
MKGFLNRPLHSVATSCLLMIKAFNCSAMSRFTVTPCTCSACCAAMFKTSSSVVALITASQSKPASEQCKIS